jgi:hypothetical protein
LSHFNVRKNQQLRNYAIGKVPDLSVASGYKDLKQGRAAILDKTIYLFAYLIFKSLNMDILSLVLQLASGAAGGTLAGKLLPKSSISPVVNALLGVVGGGLGGQILGMLGLGGGAEAAASAGISGIISNLLGGGVGGGVLMALIGVVRNMMAPKQ